MFNDSIEIIPPISVVNKQFQKKINWLQLQPTYDRQNTRIGLSWRLSDCIRRQWMTSPIRRAQKWFRIVSNDNDVKVKYLSYGKCATDAVAFRSTKRGNIATTYSNCSVRGTAFSSKYADLISLTNLKEGYANSVLHQKPVDEMIKLQHHVGEM